MIVVCRGVTGMLEEISHTYSVGINWRYNVDIYDKDRNIHYHMEDVSNEEIALLDDSFKYKD